MTHAIALRLAIALALLSTQACAVAPPFAAVPVEKVDAAVVTGYANLRAAPFSGVNELITDYRNSFAQTAAEDPAPGGGKLNFSSLYVSGGGDYGAFGAGVLYGWSEAGDRPEFKVVTGVSTGALTAPLAFIGESRDEELKQIFTAIKADDVFITSLLSGIFGGEALADTAPLRSMISEVADADLIDEVAREHRKGRRLYILTTDIGAQQPWIWNLGAIAASDRPDRFELFRKVLLASSAIPGLFPPIAFDVEADGLVFQELHVDGGVSAQIFGLSSFPPLRAEAAKAYGVSPANVTHTVYAIRNGVIGRRPSEVGRNPLSILFASYQILSKVDSLKDLALIMEEAENNGDAFRMHAIPDDFDTNDYSPFDREVMQELFERGRKATLTGDTWLRSPNRESAPKVGKANSGDGQVALN